MDTEDLMNLAPEPGGVKFTCGCGKRVLAPRPGAVVRCPKCRRVLKVPNTSAEPSAKVAEKGSADRLDWGRWAPVIVGAVVAAVSVAIVMGRAASRSGPRPGEDEATATADDSEAAEGAARRRMAAVGDCLGVALAVLASMILTGKIRRHRDQRSLLARAAALKDQGDAFYNLRQFTEAKEAYEQALGMLAGFEGKCYVLSGMLEELLRSDDIKHGADPAYKFEDGKWVLKI